MASAFEVPEDKVALFDVELQLTAEQACMEPRQLQNALRGRIEELLEESASALLTAQVTSMAIDQGEEACSGARRRKLRKLLSEFSTATATIQMMLVFAPGANARFNDEAFESMPGVNSIRSDPRNSPKLDVSSELDCHSGPSGCGVLPFGVDDDDKSDSTNVALIAGAAGGGAALLLVAVGAYMCINKKQGEDDIMMVQTINVEDLKAQLAQDL
eukprot:932243-Rhodomonas_salina.1